MQSIGSIQPSIFNNTKPTRNDIIKKFVDKLNSDRIFNKRKPLAPRFYAIKMSMLNEWDLDNYYRECERSDNFCRMWWGRIKIKK